MQRLDGGDHDYATIQREGWQTLERAGMKPDYFAIRSALDLSVPEAQTHELVVLIAARLGNARLIDNLRVSVPR